ncbi:hypothetical protein ACH47B_04175 [Rhodococcus sp. NPDC019627]|uniref:hypothetical protein n=1 Tax=unclassified Rhodococcus (in: high G+C Gram-positive bacteria) TaxID=192944 RepID=UPI0033F9DC10
MVDSQVDVRLQYCLTGNCPDPRLRLYQLARVAPVLRVVRGGHAEEDIGGRLGRADAGL